MESESELAESLESESDFELSADEESDEPESLESLEPSDFSDVLDESEARKTDARAGAASTTKASTKPVRIVASISVRRRAGSRRARSVVSMPAPSRRGVQTAAEITAHL